MMDWRDLDTWRRMDPDATFALAMQLEDRLRAARGGCKILSQGDACDCGLCKREREIERLKGIICELRRDWFIRHLKSRAPEREWEDEAKEALRMSQNDTLRAKYDEQTEALLSGRDVPLTPMCGYDMEEPPS